VQGVTQSVIESVASSNVEKQQGDDSPRLFHTCDPMLPFPLACTRLPGHLAAHIKGQPRISMQLGCTGNRQLSNCQVTPAPPATHEYAGA
jgi:hypothetical protein